MGWLKGTAHMEAPNEARNQITYYFDIAAANTFPGREFGF